MTGTIKIIADGTAAPQLALRLLALGLLPTRAPDMLEVDDEPLGAMSDWPEVMGRARRSVDAAWYEGDRRSSAARAAALCFRLGNDPGRVDIECSLARLDARDLFLRLVTLPIAAATIHDLRWSRHPAWKGARPPQPRFIAVNGWAALFRGAGHAKVASRRVLAQGPWRVLRGPGDTTMVVLYDPEADAEQALEQARPAQAFLGLGAIRGYVSPTTLPVGRYDPASRSARFASPAGQASEAGPIEEICGLRDLAAGCEHPLPTLEGWTPRAPVEHLAWEFEREEDARRALFGLWLREIACWSREGGLHRLDEGYRPPAPEIPAWVGADDRAELEARPADRRDKAPPPPAPPAVLLPVTTLRFSARGEPRDLPGLHAGLTELVARFLAQYAGAVPGWWESYLGEAFLHEHFRQVDGLDLRFVFPDPGGECSRSVAMAEAWFEFAVAAQLPEVRQLAAAHGLRLESPLTGLGELLARPPRGLWTETGAADPLPDMLRPGEAFARAQVARLLGSDTAAAQAAAGFLARAARPSAVAIATLPAALSLPAPGLGEAVTRAFASGDDGALEGLRERVVALDATGFAVLAAWYPSLERWIDRARWVALVADRVTETTFRPALLRFAQGVPDPEGWTLEHVALATALAGLEGDRERFRAYYPDIGAALAAKRAIGGA